MPNCLRVLIVEDSEDDALLMVNELECAGFQVAYKRVQTAEQTSHALAGDIWDLVVADYKMPRFSGNAALKLVRDRGLDMPFILVSGKIGEETAVEAMKAGAHDYVMKDNLTRLVPAVQRELREAQIRRERKRADEALHESEFRFRQIYDHAPVMMHSLDEDAVIRNVNTKWLKEMGYEREEVIGRKIDFLMTPESRQRLWAALARLWREEKVSDLFYQYVRKHGAVMDVLLDSVVVHDPVWGKVSLTVVRDITAQRRAENALRESEERYRTLIETMNEGFGIQDVKGIITYANHKLCEMLQCSQQELIGRSANDFFDAFDQTVDHLPKMLNDTSYEVTWTGKNGGRVATIMSPRPLFNFQGEFIGSCAVITDISERKRKEEEVSRLRHQLELILSSAWEGILGLDREGNHIFVNLAAARLLGYEVEELIGKKTHAIWHHFKLDGSPYPEEECPIYTALKTGIAYHSTDEVLWKKNGTSLTAEFAVSPIKEGSQVIGAVATFWDTTRRKRDEQVIRAARETLEAIFNAITESLILLDRDGLVVSMNKTAAERLGETEEKLTGRSIYDLLAPGTENRRAEYETVIQSRRPSRFEDKQGEMILDQHVYPVFGPDSSVERLAIFARDITEQKLTEDELRQSEERFRMIFESARDCIYIRDRNQKYTHVNPAMEKIFGLPASELIGRTPCDLMTREQAACTGGS